jgi:hypothetical protein
MIYFEIRKWHIVFCKHLKKRENIWNLVAIYLDAFLKRFFWLLSWIDN